MTPQACCRWQRCNASVCPLDLRDGYHRSGEPVCYYLRNSGKAGAGERFRGDPVFQEVILGIGKVRARYPAIAKAIDRAAKSPFKAEHWRSKGRALCTPESQGDPEATQAE